MLEAEKRLEEVNFFYKKSFEINNAKETLYYLSATILFLRSVQWLLKAA